MNKLTICYVFIFLTILIYNSSAFALVRTENNNNYVGNIRQRRPGWGLSSTKNNNNYVGNMRRPEICMLKEYRCILRSSTSISYWCVKSQMQRTRDTRYRSQHNMNQTRRNVEGNCSKIIYIR